MENGFSSDEIEGRLSAQRRVLQWLLARADAEDGELRELLDQLDETYPPADHQEDPGAVPTSAFGTFAAQTAEMRLLLEPLRQRLAAGRDVPFAEG